MSEIFAQAYAQAASDAAAYKTLFPASKYLSYVTYQKGRAHYFTGQNSEALAELTTFCHTWGTHELYPSALYWIAECMYADYNFEAAKALFGRIVTDFPSDAKVLDSRYRLETIAQREREEKLLYLLKVTGEEYLAAKEEYEKQLTLNRVEEMVELQQQMRVINNEMESLKKELDAAQRRTNEQDRLINALETRNDAAEQQIRTQTQNPSAPAAKAPNPELSNLLDKARLLRTIIESENAGEVPQ
jgi:TolA-binding protein